jgi:alpha-1,2-mannosyltransferase
MHSEHSNSDGGGERVLWTAVKAIQQRYPSHRIIIYTGDKEGSPRDIILNTKVRPFSSSRWTKSP